MSRYDAIVIGSGIGGLTAAGLLARVAGQRVLVLERHTVPGGLTHTFRRDGASWDVGLHYVGQVAPGSPARAYFDYLSGGQLEWNRMSEGYDRFVYPGIDLTAPAGAKRYAQRLIDAFPGETRSIRRYFRDVRRATAWMSLEFMQGMVPGPVAPMLRVLQRVTGRTATRTTRQYLKARFRCPELRALLASQWGDYGLPPSHSAFATHALIVSHYLEGGWFPAGGSQRIARTFEQGIEQAGGAVRVAQEVTEILVEDGHATGVRVLDHRGPESTERIHRAPVVVSDAGASLTFSRLLPTTGQTGRATAAVRAAVGRAGAGTSAVTVYLRLREDPRSIGADGGNVWVYRDLDHDDTVGHCRALLSGSPRSVFVSFPSVKSGEEHHTAEIISFVDAEAFEAWRDHPKGNRGAGYGELKQRIGDGMLRLAETAIPGLSGLVEYTEVSTPLTVEDYTSHPRGAFYGVPATPQRYRSMLLGPKTPIPGLYLAGQDAGSLGIIGAMMGGVAAACQVLGPRGFPAIQAAVRAATPPTQADVTAPLPPGKHHARLAAKRRLTPSIWEAVFSVEGELGRWAAGQSARLHVGGSTWRDYSIAAADGQNVRFLISTRTGGPGSRFIEHAEAGTHTMVELPLGRFVLAPSHRRQVFVATGTGLAPFLPMLAQGEHLDEATLVFGCRTREDDLTVLLEDQMPGTVVRCISREDVSGALHGRVTDALTDLEFDAEETDFYLCGSAAMVADCRALLERRGARHLFAEAY